MNASDTRQDGRAAGRAMKVQTVMPTNLMCFPGFRDISWEADYAIAPEQVARQLRHGGRCAVVCFGAALAVEGRPRGPQEPRVRIESAA